MYFGVVYVCVVFNDDVAARVAQDQVCSSCPGLWPVAVALRCGGKGALRALLNIPSGPKCSARPVVSHTLS